MKKSICQIVKRLLAITLASSVLLSLGVTSVAESEDVVDSVGTQLVDSILDSSVDAIIQNPIESMPSDDQEQMIDSEKQDSSKEPSIGALEEEDKQADLLSEEKPTVSNPIDNPEPQENSDEETSPSPTLPNKPTFYVEGEEASIANQIALDMESLDRLTQANITKRVNISQSEITKYEMHTPSNTNAKDVNTPPVADLVPVILNEETLKDGNITTLTQIAFFWTDGETDFTYDPDGDMIVG